MINALDLFVSKDKKPKAEEDEAPCVFPAGSMYNLKNSFVLKDLCIFFWRFVVLFCKKRYFMVFFDPLQRCF